MDIPLLRLGRCRVLPLLVLLLAAPLTQAQTQTQTRSQPQDPSVRADPLDAQARVPAAAYRSALDGYRRLGEDTRVDWKAANERVNQVGGWRAYAREAQQPEPAASAPASRGAPGPAPAHGGHKTH